MDNIVSTTGAPIAKPLSTAFIDMLGEPYLKLNGNQM
jgi:hypothetical protein